MFCCVFTYRNPNRPILLLVFSFVVLQQISSRISLNIMRNHAVVFILLKLWLGGPGSQKHFPKDPRASAGRLYFYVDCKQLYEQYYSGSKRHKEPFSVRMSLSLRSCRGQFYIAMKLLYSQLPIT